MEARWMAAFHQSGRSAPSHRKWARIGDNLESGRGGLRAAARNRLPLGSVLRADPLSAPASRSPWMDLGDDLLTGLDLGPL